MSGVRVLFTYADPVGLGPLLGEAASAGVERVVLLSALGVDEAPASTSNPIVRMHRAAEAAVADSGLDRVTVRAGGFATNTLQWASSVRETRTVETAFPDARLNLVHERDVAEVLAAAMIDDDARLVGRAVPVTGPAALSQREQVETIGAAVGEPVRLVELSPEAYRGQLSRWGDDDMVDALVEELDGATRRDPPEPRTVAHVTGGAPRSFATWVADHVDDFA